MQNARAALYRTADDPSHLGARVELRGDGEPFGVARAVLRRTTHHCHPLSHAASFLLRRRRERLGGRRLAAEAVWATVSRVPPGE
jgi:hypothetical protein